MNKLYIKTNRLLAEGLYEDGKLTIVKGSQASKEVASSLPESQLQKRDELISDGILTDKGQYLVFNSNYTCSSPSQASNLITGTSSNGLMVWKDETGNTLKSLLRNAEK